MVAAGHAASVLEEEARLGQLGLTSGPGGWRSSGSRSPSRPTIALCMIVRNEAAILPRCLRSVRPLIDAWVICDTGSSDGTQEVIARELADVPGELHETTWVDFGHNRSELLELARGGADYLLLLDADMTVRVDATLPELSADAYLLREAGRWTSAWCAWCAAIGHGGTWAPRTSTSRPTGSTPRESCASWSSSTTPTAPRARRS